MHPAIRLLLALIVVGAVIGGGYYLWQRHSSQQQPAAPAATATPPSSTAPVVQHPIEEAAAESKEAALPALNDSDPVVKTAMASVFPKSWEQFFVLDGFVRRVVATVDALPRKSVPQRVLPMKPVPGRFATTGQAEGLLIARENSTRYLSYLKLAEGVDTRQIVALYV